MGVNDHIPTEQILQDIGETEREISIARQEIPALETLARCGDRMAQFRADARRTGIKEREEFIAKLQRLLRERGYEKPTPRCGSPHAGSSTCPGCRQ